MPGPRPSASRLLFPFETIVVVVVVVVLVVVFSGVDENNRFREVKRLSQSTQLGQNFELKLLRCREPYALTQIPSCHSSLLPKHYMRLRVKDVSWISQLKML